MTVDVNMITLRNGYYKHDRPCMFMTLPIVAILNMLFIIFQPNQPANPLCTPVWRRFYVTKLNTAEIETSVTILKLKQKKIQ